MTSSYVIVPQGWQREVAVGQEYVYYIRSVRRGQGGKLCMLWGAEKWGVLV